MKRVTEAELAKELREKYIKNPPEGMTSEEVRTMSDDDLLDMDYFLHEFDDEFDDEMIYREIASPEFHLYEEIVMADDKQNFSHTGSLVSVA